MDHGNPLAIQDVHLVINRDNPIDKLIEDAAARVRAAGGTGAIDMQNIDQRIETIRAHWDAEKTALLCTMRDLFLGLAKGAPDSEIKLLLEKKVRAWRKAEHVLQQDYDAEKRALIGLETNLKKVTQDITQSYALMRTGSAEVAAFRVLLNAHRTLRDLWGQHVELIAKENALDNKLYQGTAQGLHVLFRTVIRELQSDLSEESREYTTIKSDVERLATAQGVGLAKECERLKRMFFEKVYSPLTETNPELLELPSDALESTDPFCVRRCVAAEEALRQLAPVLGSSRPQAEARVKNQARIADLRRHLAVLQQKTQEQLLADNVESSKVASVLHAIRYKEQSVQKELQELLSEVDNYEDQHPASDVDPEQMADTIERVRMMCTKVKNTVTLSMRSTLAMQSMARIQHTENVERLQLAAVDMVQQSTTKALESIQSKRSVIQRVAGEAAEAMSKAGVVDDARNRQRFSCLTTAEMSLHAMIERNVQLDREMTVVLARRARLRGMLTASKFIQSICVRLMAEIH